MRLSEAPLSLEHFVSQVVSQPELEANTNRQEDAVDAGVLEPLSLPHGLLLYRLVALMQRSVR